MKKIVVVVFAVCLLSSCKEVAYPDREPRLILEDSAAKKAVPIDNVEYENANTTETLPINANRIVDTAEKVAFVEDRKAKLPKIEVISLIDKAYVDGKHIDIKGLVDNPELVQELLIQYQGTSGNNNSISGEKKVNGMGKNFSVTINAELPDGDYRFSMKFMDLQGNVHQLPELKISVDAPPKILGAMDGIAQPAYLQETNRFEQKLIEDGKNIRYEVYPVETKAPLDFGQTPTINRWLNHIDDENTAPTYVFKLTNDADIASVKYSLGYDCVPLEKVAKDAGKNSVGLYEIKLTSTSADIDLSKNVEDKKLCLSILAIDHKGNQAYHQVEFFWKVMIPPVSADVNAARYNPREREEDISWAKRKPWKLFIGNEPIELKRNLVVGHVIISNPFASAVEASLHLTKGMELKLNGQKYQIPHNHIAIRYFAYDVAKNKIGAERTLNNDSAVLKSNETIVAKFILSDDVPIHNVRHPHNVFWQSFSLELDFAKNEDKSVVDGMMLMVRDSDSNLSSEFAVLWGDEHDARRKAAPMQ